LQTNSRSGPYKAPLVELKAQSSMKLIMVSLPGFQVDVV